MLSIFRTNQVTFNIAILVYLIILRLPLFIFNPQWESASVGVFSNFIFQLFGYNSLGIHILTTLVIFAEAILINELAIQHRLNREINLFQGLFFAAIVCLIPDFLVPLPLHFANLFLIIALGELWSTYRKTSCEDRIFNVGFWLAVASFFYFSYVVFVLLCLVGLNSMRALKFKEILIMLIGFAVPNVLVGTYLYWKDQLSFFWKIQYAQNIGWLDFNGLNVIFSWLVAGVFMLVLLISIFGYSRFMLRKKRQEQTKIDVLYWLTLLALLSIFIQSDISLGHLLILAVPLGFFVGFFFTMLSRQVAEVLHLLILAGIFFFQYGSLFFR